MTATQVELGSPGSSARVSVTALKAVQPAQKLVVKYQYPVQRERVELMRDVQRCTCVEIHIVWYMDCVAPFDRAVLLEVA